ncbi:dienelactone hydrolase family protein [Bosea sp. UNC402CLCol]|uniref:dienelactone hydrolase family protein n=1 Tax=Bosea sp. UNC402CLCol TaxID=1510531 RepID=UPI00068E9A44|nr:dienelactone hydrolase family protein [Bosea sp. UNC402CLCol]
MHMTAPAQTAAESTLEQLDGLVREPFSRRGFVMTGLISGFTLATSVIHGQTISTDSKGLVAGEVKIPTADGELPGYRAMPEGAGPFPIVLVIEEIFGVHEYIKDICRRFAKLGYCAVAPELYARLGDLSKMTDVQAIVRDVISKAPDATVLSDLDATAKWAAAASKGDAARLGVTGFCRGGRAVWLYAAHNPQVKAAVAWYGPLGGSRTDIQPKTAADVVGDLKAPVLGLYGGADTGIPVADVEKQRDAAKAAGKTVEIVIFPDTPHGFHADYRPSYRKAQAEDGWARALAWFKRYGVA